MHKDLLSRDIIHIFFADTYLQCTQQQPRGDFALLRGPPSSSTIEILGGDLRQSLCPVREFPGDAEIVKGWKPVPPWNRFRTTTRIAWRTRQILAEFAFRSKPEFGAFVLRGHAESRRLSISTQAFRRVSEIHQFLRAAGLG